MPSCCIKQCGARKNKNQPGLTIHRFPVNEILKKKWLSAIGTENINTRHKIWYVCSTHFDKSCFNRTLDVTRLHENAVPSSSLMSPGTMQVQPLLGQLAPSAPMNRRSSLRGTIGPCAPLIVTAGSAPSLETNIPEPLPIITYIKSELDPVEIKEDPQCDDSVSLDEEDQLSDDDQPCEDLIPLSNDQVPLTNAQDPLTELKVEEPEVTVDDTKVKVEEDEVTEPEVQVSGSASPTMQVPLRVSQEVFRAANDNSDLIRTQSKQIVKLTACCAHTQRQLTNMVQLLKRRDNTISSLRLERDELASYIARRGGSVGGVGAGRIQIESANNTVEENKQNRKLYIVKHVRKNFVKPTTSTSVSVKSTSQISSRNPSENGGVKRTLNIVERSSLGIQDTPSNLNKSSVVTRTSKTPPVSFKETLDNRQQPSIAVKPMSDVVKSPTLVIQPKLDSRKFSSVGVQGKSVNRQKPTITVKHISEIIKSPSVVVQPESDNRQVPSVGDQQPSVMRRKPSVIIKPISEIMESPSLVQPTSDNRQVSSVGVQRTSDFRQNAVVIQIDGMHNTVLQPKLVRLDDCMEMD